MSVALYQAEWSGVVVLCSILSALCTGLLILLAVVLWRWFCVVQSTPGKSKLQQDATPSTSASVLPSSLQGVPVPLVNAGLDETMLAVGLPQGTFSAETNPVTQRRLRYVAAAMISTASKVDVVS